MDVHTPTRAESLGEMYTCFNKEELNINVLKKYGLTRGGATVLERFSTSRVELPTVDTSEMPQTNSQKDVSCCALYYSGFHTADGAIQTSHSV
jgi:hypothetical protein